MKLKRKYLNFKELRLKYNSTNSILKLALKYATSHTTTFQNAISQLTKIDDIEKTTTSTLKKQLKHLVRLLKKTWNAVLKIT